MLGGLPDLPVLATILISVVRARVTRRIRTIRGKQKNKNYKTEDEEE